jgi:murein DD-endopeptidase MepM/ murein hydrolase activator NlpD
MAPIAVLSVLCLAIVALPGRRASAQATETTTTTEPAPDTTTTTEPAPDTTTTTEPAPDTSTTIALPSDPTTTSPPSTMTVPTGPEVVAGTLLPAEALASRPEFAALTDHQRALVQDLQTATDVYALRRFGLLDLAHQVDAAKDVLKEARTGENAAVKRELFGLAKAVLSINDVAAPAGSAPDVGDSNRPARAVAHGRYHDAGLDGRLAEVRALGRRLEADRKNAHLARVQAQAGVAAASARLAAQTQAVADASAARSAAESAIEHELGSGAVRARPDGITATLATAQAGQPDPIVIGGIRQPVPGATLSSPFGLRNDPLGGGAGFHPGVDFAAGAGTPIHAAAAGVVVTAGDCGGYGNCVVIDHGVSMATVYGHESEVLVRVGEQVDAGQVIGLVGSSGMSTGPHLHFEVRLHGLPIDPLLALLPD